MYYMSVQYSMLPHSQFILALTVLHWLIDNVRRRQGSNQTFPCWKEAWTSDILIFVHFTVTETARNILLLYDDDDDGSNLQRMNMSYIAPTALGKTKTWPKKWCVSGMFSIAQHSFIFFQWLPGPHSKPCFMMPLLQRRKTVINQCSEFVPGTHRPITVLLLTQTERCW